MIAEHNAKLLERNNLVANSSEKNVLVKDMDRALMEMRRTISVSVDNQINVLQNQMSRLQRSEKQTSAKLASNPNQAKVLLSVERQQAVKQSLYLYLLQKREENELSQAFTAYNTRLIRQPRTNYSPIAPKSQMILLIGFVIGFAIPLAIIVLRELLTTTVRGRQDLKNITLPFLGEIPNCFPKRTGFARLKKKTETENKVVVVKAGNRNIENEAFRSLRTNLDFIIKDNSSNAIALTSYNPGSGKSFISINLAIALAIQNKKVLVIDGDLRHASVSQFVGGPKLGISDFLAGRISDVNDVVVKDKTYASLHVLPVGTIPPNPAELLAQDLFKTMIEKFKKEYDYVIVDCPPIEIVTDTHIIERSVDRTIFVIRAGLLERSMLGDLQRLYVNGTFKNMSCILNGTKKDNSKYGYKYGYRYGSYYSNNEN
jgi:capsular exopolysaccharide synthesis family protein